MRIQEFINRKNKYKVDYNYQRPVDVWSNQDNQCLIDTILRGEPIPMFFFNAKTDEEGNIVYYIVDGQQRLNCIRKFYDNKIKLSSKFSDEKYDGCTFNGDKPIPDTLQDDFLNYDLKVHVVEDYDDERVRMIFSRLQRGKPLNLGERLNALPGNVVVTMRELAKNKFIDEIICVNKNRYNVFPIVARMMYYEQYDTKECSSEYLYKYFDDYKDENIKGKIYNTVAENLNYLSRCFPAGGKYFCLEKDARIMSLYTMVSYLRKYYAMTGHENDVKKFAISFFNKVYNEDIRRSNFIYNKFYDISRGGWGENLLTLRQKILVDEFLKSNYINDLDVARQITDSEKSILFEKHPYCEMCKKEFKFYNEPEYHHIERYTDGGKRENNIEILCSECHDIIHGKKIKDIDKIENEIDNISESEEEV